MEIKVKIEAVVNVVDGEANINEILEAIGTWSNQVGLDVSKGVIENYQEQMVKLLCEGKGKSSWVTHEHKDDGNGQLCIGGSFRRGGFRRKERVFRTAMGKISIKLQQIICNVCDRKFTVLLPLLKIPKRSRTTVKIKQMSSETIAELSYRRSNDRIEGLAQINIPKSILHRWMTTQDWDLFTDEVHTEDMWKSFAGIMADGTGYKRQKADTTKGNLRIVMGVKKDGTKKLIPLGVWADKSWEDIDKELSDKKPDQIKPPVLTVDGEKGQQSLGNLTDGIQRCQWHIWHQLGYYLWQDGLAKRNRDKFIKQLSGIIKIELPKEDYKEISDEMKKDVQEKIEKSKESIEDLINTFQSKGYGGASTYLENAVGHILQ